MTSRDTFRISISAAVLIAFVTLAGGARAYDQTGGAPVSAPLTESTEAPAEIVQQQQDQDAAVASPSSVAPSSPGLFNVLGGFIKDSTDSVTSGLKGTQQRIDDINKGALDTLTRLPSAGMVTGRIACQMASNGAPDCYAAAETLCKGKGFSNGKSLLTESAETCKPRVLIPGYKRKDGDCRIDTIVTRASCS